MNIHTNERVSGRPTILMLGLGLALFSGCQRHSMPAESDAPTSAVCVLRSIGDSGVHGTIHLRARNGTLHVTGTVSGLAPGKHGFHVHEFGDLSNLGDGSTAGDHFAPGGTPHGRPSDEKRHVGDLGNLEADASGKAVIDISDGVLTLTGGNSVLGRAIVVHAGEDKFSQPSGDAGKRVAFGVIGIAGACSD